MNSKQRKQAKKQKTLIKLGRDAHRVIADAQAREAAWQREAEATKQAKLEVTSKMHDAMEQAATFADAVKAAETECRRQLQDEASKFSTLMANAAAGHRTEIADLKKAHEAELQRLSIEMAERERKVAALRKAYEEPEKLRRRLHAKQQEIVALRAQSNVQAQADLKLAADEPLHVPVRFHRTR